MKHANIRNNTGCSENGILLSRRSLLGISAGLFSSAFLPSFASADINNDARLLIVVLRGGMDGINTLIPSFDPHYESARRQIAIESGEALTLTDGFNLHPSMRNLHTFFSDGQVAFVPAAGLAMQNRSHFECQENLENGLSGNPSNSTGWVNRLMGMLPSGDPIRTGRAIAVGGSPLIVRGREPILNWSSTWFNRADESLVSSLEGIYQQTDPQLAESFALGLEADRLAGGVAAADNHDTAPLLVGFQGAARMLGANYGPRVAVLSIDGWDTHLNQGGVNGVFADRLDILDQAIGVFKHNVGNQAWDNTVVICVTEFGRTAQVNGTRGTDHGVGMPVIMVGGALRGGIYSDWPGLAENQLLNGVDLRPTIDVRSIFKGVLSEHLGVARDILDNEVFPDSARERPLEGLIRRPARTLERGGAPERSLVEMARDPIARYRRENGV